MKFERDKILFFIIALLVVGLIGGWVKRLTYLPFYWLSVISLLVYTIYFNRGIIVKRIFIVPIITGLVLIFYDLLGHYNDVPDVYLYPFGPLTDIYPFVIASIVLLNILSTNRIDSFILKLSKFSIWLLAIGSVLTLITETLYPGTSRVRDLSEVPRYLWTFTFGTFYSLPFLLLALLGALRGFKKFIVSFLVLGLSAYTGFLTLTIFTFVAILLSYYDSFTRWVKLLTMILSIVLIVVISSIGVNKTAITILTSLPHKQFTEKAKMLEEVSKDKSADVEDLRGDVYSLSLDSFYGNPIFGIGSYSTRFIGYHSFWLDKLGFVGLFGALFYVIILYGFYRFLYNWLFPYVLSWKRINLLLVVLLFLNPFQFWDFWIIVYVIVPIIIKVNSLNIKLI